MPATAAYANTDDIFRALSDPTRREILGLLRFGSASVGDLAANFNVSRPAISKHLRVLREAQLIKNRPQGTSSICELNAAPLKTIDVWLNDYKRFWDRSLLRLKAQMERP